MTIQAIRDLLNGKKIIIYGAGKIGRRVFYSLKSLGYKVEFFWDKNVGKITQFSDVTILKPDFESIPLALRGEYMVLVTIYAKDISRVVADSLSSHGYPHVVHERDIVNSIIYRTCQTEIAENRFSFDFMTCYSCSVHKESDNTSCDIFDSRLVDLAKGIDPSSFRSKAEKHVNPKDGLLISNRCNLTCKGCNHLIDLYQRSDPVVDFTPDDLVSDLSKVVGAVDLINYVSLVGGEALLHREFSEILEKVTALPKIGYVQIITNGSIVPKDRRLFELMVNPRVVVEISGYGEELAKKLQSNVESFVSELKRYGVNYHYMNTLQWFDFGDFQVRPYLPEQHRDVYRNCCIVSNDIFNGKMYKCSRSAAATFLHRIPDYPEDYVDLRGCPADKLRTRLIEFLNFDRPHACMHCNGASVVIDAGVQIPRFISLQDVSKQSAR